MKNINLMQIVVWQVLQKYFDEMKDVMIVDFFVKDGDCFFKFFVIFDDQMLVDYFKNCIIEEMLVKLQDLVKECDLVGVIKLMFFGEKINCIENCVVLYVVLCNCSNILILVDGKDVMLEVNVVLEKMKIFLEVIIFGEWKGYIGKVIIDVVNIGIGGFDFGLYMVIEVLCLYKNYLNMYFVFNVDGIYIVEVLKKVNLEIMLFLVVFKIFIIQEIMINVYSVCDWFLKVVGDEKYVVKYFVVFFINVKVVGEFGIDIVNMFEFWDWVGGCYFLWLVIGLLIVFFIGFDNFVELFFGVYVMDKYFFIMFVEKNLFVLLVLIGIWYNNFFGVEIEVILLYDQYMYCFVVYFQQGNMEFNGKYVDCNGNVVDYQIGLIIWGESGINGQYVFYQLIYQGIKMVLCDFIVLVIIYNLFFDYYQKLLFNFFVQIEVLVFGKFCEVVEQEYCDQGKDLVMFDYVVLFKVFEGNCLINFILLCEIILFSLGVLIVLYEYKIFIQGVILNIFIFDQWGVELGKQLVNCILLELKDDKEISSYDSLINGLINCYKVWCG